MKLDNFMNNGFQLYKHAPMCTINVGHIFGYPKRLKKLLFTTKKKKKIAKTNGTKFLSMPNCKNIYK